MKEYIKEICCGNCGATVNIDKEVELPVEFSFICHNCHQIRKEQLKINTVGDQEKSDI